MATVYLAQVTAEHNFERWVAIKVVHPELADDASFATMLADEARLVARVHHPNVCSVVDLGREGKRLYMVMEYLHGETLSAAARRSWTETASFPAWLVARSVADAAHGLHAAHELADHNGDSFELVHRDISGGNILVSYDGPSVVLDFGVVAGRGRKTKTQEGEIKGKLSHMAPEQLMAQGVDRRADVWSLGVLLWEATLGRRLFRGETHADTLSRVTHRPIPRPTEVTKHYPPMLEAIVMGALERDLSRRTPDAEVLARQLESYLYSLGRPAGHSEVAVWMRETFSDRLMVREALLTAPEDSGPIHIEQLTQGETSVSFVLPDGGIGYHSFAPPAPADGEEQTAVGTPTAKKAREEAVSQNEPAEGLDEELRSLRRTSGRRSAVLWILLLIVGLLAAALSYQLVLAS